MTDPLADVLRRVDRAVRVVEAYEDMARAAREHIAAEIWARIESMGPILPTEEGWAEGMSDAAEIARGGTP